MPISTENSVKALSLKPETMKQLEDRAETLEDLDTGNGQGEAL